MNLKKTSKMVLSLSAKIVFWIICLTVFIIICTKAYAFGNLIFSDKGMVEEGNGTDVTVSIPAGATSSQVADILIEDELIESKAAFMIQAILYEAEFISGDYVLSTEDSPEEIITLLKPTEE